MYKKDHLLEYKKLIESLSTKLKPNGKIVVGYLYDIENENDYREIYKKEKRDSIFNEDNYSYYYFRKMNDLHRDYETSNHDACLVYTKK